LSFAFVYGAKVWQQVQGTNKENNKKDGEVKNILAKKLKKLKKS